MMEDFRAHLDEVRARVAAACARAGRSPDSVELIAVSKTVPIDRCAAAVAAGQTLLGENYAQELRDKARAIPGARWHFIGGLQRNKVKYVVGVAELIHTIDSVELLDAIAARAAQHGVVQRCLIEVNVGEETQKGGVPASALPALLDEFAKRPSVICEGLMCIPPAEIDPVPHFRALAALADKHGLRHRSMGMSADFEQAIEHGATLIRVGTALFGARKQH
jgi:pyridoxal phosphate enzyme (YggS family)